MRVPGRIVQRHAVVSACRCQPELLSQTPSGGMVRARGITGKAQPTYGIRTRIQSKPAAERDSSADALADHRVVLGAKLTELAFVRVLWAHWVPRSKTEQWITWGARLHPWV